MRLYVYTHSSPIVTSTTTTSGGHDRHSGVKLSAFGGVHEQWLTFKGLFAAYADQRHPEVTGLTEGTTDLGEGDKVVVVKYEDELEAVGKEGVLTRAVAQVQGKAKRKLAKTNRLLHSVLVSHTVGHPPPLWRSVLASGTAWGRGWPCRPSVK